MAVRTAHEDLAERLAYAQEKVEIGGLYYHYKNPRQHYKVTDSGFCEWDETICVIYKQIETDYELT